jgi:hypothetical protein
MWFTSAQVKIYGFLAQQPPDPTQGSAPPFARSVQDLLHWVFWGVSAACVAGVLIVAGKMALQHRHGEQGQHFGSLGMVLVACILAGGASAIVGAFLRQ